MELFTSPTLRISFQNKLLVYLLYKCGGFVPSDQLLGRLKREYGVEEKRVILRHGTDGRSDLAAVLSKGMSDLLRARGEDPVAGKFPGRQPSEIAWPGGFSDLRVGARTGSLYRKPAEPRGGRSTCPMPRTC